MNPAKLTRLTIPNSCSDLDKNQVLTQFFALAGEVKEISSQQDDIAGNPESSKPAVSDAKALHLSALALLTDQTYQLARYWGNCGNKEPSPSTPSE